MEEREKGGKKGGRKGGEKENADCWIVHIVGCPRDLRRSGRRIGC